ncbi:hypothetical protein EYF80_021800 [Liparis tanakae]|uniref:Uncharacterized protein n=1 Tax=Liparis tanakae TaxID=230148 RepID=A0A4Z2HQI1_9TELE|nr:hypothetical protein EYF80_021800 [Liparis tanakae]
MAKLAMAAGRPCEEQEHGCFRGSGWASCRSLALTSTVKLSLSGLYRSPLSGPLSTALSPRLPSDPPALSRVGMWLKFRRSDDGSLGGGQVDGLDADGQGLLQVLQDFGDWVRTIALGEDCRQLLADYLILTEHRQRSRTSESEESCLGGQSSANTQEFTLRKYLL